MERCTLPIRLAGLVLPVLGAFAPAVAAGDLDLSVADIEVNQALQTGSTTLVGGRSTFVRATIQVDGSVADVPGVDGLMRVFVGGVEAPGSPYFSNNGPIKAKLSPNHANGADTLNFVFLPPVGGDVVVTVEVNPAGPSFVAETDTANNTGSSSALDFVERKVAELAYAPVDLDPSGGSNPNPPDTALIEPGVGDNFIQGIYPSKDWNYHRIDAPTKLWTGSVSSSSGGQVLLNSLVVDANLMVPVPDYIYGWVPGALPGYNGTSQIGGLASMGNTQPIRHQRTFAHEVGHCFGLFHNGFQAGFVGVDVEMHLALTEGLPQIKATNLNDIMVAGLLTQQAWVANNSYNFFLNHPTFAVTPLMAGGPTDEPRLLVAGLWNQETGALEITDSLTFTGGRPTVAATPARTDLVVRAFAAGSLARELPISAKASLDCAGADSDVSDPVVGFNVVLPARAAGGALIDRIDVVVPGVSGDAALRLERSAAAPEVAFTSPLDGALDSGRVTVSWSATDADGDVLHSYLTYRPDGGERRVPVATSLDLNEIVVDLDDMPALVDGRGYFELMVSDGLHTTVVESVRLSASPTALGLGTNAPWTQILTPDNGLRIQQGATVVLHSSGWDLEDRALTGESLQWSSSVDGPLGSGRLLAVSDLSPGGHVLTVEATDAGGLTATDTATVIITPRGLPQVDGTVCQTDLGFDGPGDSVLEVCGGDLSTGTTANLQVTGAVPSQPAWILAGLTNDPTFAFGGLIVPIPATIVVPTSSDANGEILATGIPGGQGPFSLYVQVLHVDGSQPFGYGISNAVQIDFLP